MNTSLPRWVDIGLIPLVNLALAFFVSGLVVLAIGENPISAMKFLVTGGENRSAFAIRDNKNRAVVIDIGILRWFWERAAVAAHLPEFLAEFLPLPKRPSTLWFDPEHHTVPAVEGWPIPDDRKDYCVEIFQHMVDHLVLH